MGERPNAAYEGEFDGGGWGGHVIIAFLSKNVGVESRYVTLVFNIARCMYPFTGQAPKNGKGSSV